jgi:hypothetical protein
MCSDCRTLRHDGRVPGSESSGPAWIACEQERPSDLDTTWHVDCEGCRIKAEAEWRLADADPGGERAMFFWLLGGPPRPRVP